MSVDPPFESGGRVPSQPSFHDPRLTSLTVRLDDAQRLGDQRDPRRALASGNLLECTPQRSRISRGSSSASPSPVHEATTNRTGDDEGHHPSSHLTARSRTWRRRHRSETSGRGDVHVVVERVRACEHCVALGRGPVARPQLRFIEVGDDRCWSPAGRWRSAARRSSPRGRPARPTLRWMDRRSEPDQRRGRGPPRSRIPRRVG